MRTLNLFFIMLFVFSAIVQYNDPDPYLWMPIYLYGAYLCYLAGRKMYSKPLYIFGLFFYSIYALYLLFDSTGVLSWMKEHDSESIVQTMKATKPWIEETREFFGLLILIFALTVNMIWLRKRVPLQIQEFSEAAS